MQRTRTRAQQQWSQLKQQQKCVALNDETPNKKTSLIACQKTITNGWTCTVHPESAHCTCIFAWHIIIYHCHDWCCIVRKSSHFKILAGNDFWPPFFSTFVGTRRVLRFYLCIEKKKYHILFRFDSENVES